MISLIIVAVVAVLTYGAQASHVVPLGVTVGLTAYSHPISSLYHSQDVLGQYTYGYATPTSTKTETKTLDGVTNGGYSYIDSNGILQTVHYTADPIHGFRVAATNLPQDAPDVAAAKAQHLADYAAIRARIAVPYSNPVVVPASHVAPSPVQDLPEVAAARARHLAILNAAYSSTPQVPQPVQDLPEVVKARAQHLAIVEQTKARDAAAHFSPVELSGNVVSVHTAAPAVGVVGTSQISYTPAIIHAPASAQYHSQDELGQYSYGYVEPFSTKSETRSADGVTRGGYSYIDANGVLQTVNYIADAVHGFRVAATNLPVAPAAPVVPVEQNVVTKTVVPGLYNHEVVY